MHLTLTRFLNSLFNEGRVRVSRPAEISNKELSEADEALSMFERVYRQELSAMPPPLSVPAARWAAVTLYRACQFVAFRDVGEDMIARTMGVCCPEGDPPAIHYSVDLAFRYLPDLYKLAQAAGPQDPLLARLGRLAVEWPLSSVGMTGIGPVRIDPWAYDRCLSALYIDRVIARGDVSRLDDPCVCEAVQQAVGLFPDLAPRMAAASAPDAVSQNLDWENVP
jgi:hypothetical protein